MAAKKYNIKKSVMAKIITLENFELCYKYMADF